MLVLVAAAAGACGVVGSAAAQVPAAVVEEVKGKVMGVEFMDYVEAGKVIKLGPKDSIVLGYMKSCWRETITGGTVIVGAEQSMVHLGKIERSKVDCDASNMQLTSREAGQGAATVFRSMSRAEQAAAPPQITLYGLSPVVEVKERGTLTIERVDQPGERHELAVGGKTLVRGKFYDLAKARKALAPGGTYVATFGTAKVLFKIDPQAKPGPTPIIGRLLRIG
jgi:hypothetical protein